MNQKKTAPQVREPRFHGTRLIQKGRITETYYDSTKINSALDVFLFTEDNRSHEVSKIPSSRQQLMKSPTKKSAASKSATILPSNDAPIPASELKLASSLLRKRIPAKGLPESMLYQGDCEKLLDHWIATATEPFLDLVFTSPPYNLGKEYESKTKMDEYLVWQKRIIQKSLKVLKPSGSLVWQVGNYVANGHICPLDLELAPIFKELGLQMRNRVVWAYGHGMHCKRRFSGRYEVALWYTKTEDYTFNLDAVRIPSKWPHKKHFKGPKRGELSCNPLGKNPEDLWQIPHVQSSHPEKTGHPCQFPIELPYRFILALTNENDIVFDPFGGVATTACAAALTGRRFYSSETNSSYNKIGALRVAQASLGTLKYREIGKPILAPPSSKS